MKFSIFGTFIAAASCAAAFGLAGMPAHAAGLSEALPSAGISYVLSPDGVSLADVEESLVASGAIAQKQEIETAVGAAAVTEEGTGTTAQSAILTTVLTDDQQLTRQSAASAAAGTDAAALSDASAQTSGDTGTGASADTAVTAVSTDATADAGTDASADTAAAAGTGDTADAGTEESAAAATSIAVSSAEDFVNIRSEASTDADIVGKLYKDSVATILEADSGNGWVRISSGDVTGYVKSDYLKTGSEAQKIADANATSVAKVTTETLRVRAAASLDADVISLVPQGETLNIISQKDGWIEVETDDGFGYISADFADVDKVYEQAVSSEQEKAEASKSAEQKAADEAKDKATEAAKKAADAEQKAEEARAAADKSAQEAKDAASSTASSGSSTAENAGSAASTAAADAEKQQKAAEEAAQAAADAQKKAEEAADKAEEEAKAQKEAADQAEEKADEAQKAADKASTSSSNSSGTTVSGSGTGAAVANYAMQFLGNPYVYGGTSLTNGADCSGFVMSVYKHFGVNLPHYDAADRTQGTAVSSLAEAQAGDIVCYYGHVGIYIGNGQIVNASNPRNGIMVTNASYREIVAIRRIFS